MDEKAHWEKVYQSKAPDAVSWYRAHLDKSLEIIRKAEPDRSSSILDVGAGAATLVDDLLADGYRHVSVLDISETAIAVSKERLGERSSLVNWICANITELALPEKQFDVWHDRAVFHFLTSEEQRLAYVRNVARAVKPGGHVIVATFGPEGPEKCSGLSVVRYDADSLHDQFGAKFELVESVTELHQTPFGTTQQFLYCYCKIA